MGRHLSMWVQQTQELSCQQEDEIVGALLVRASSVRATQKMHEECGMCILKGRAAGMICLYIK